MWLELQEPLSAGPVWGFGRQKPYLGYVSGKYRLKCWPPMLSVW